uniref:Serpin domain-containing protein n=1 Tax=Panagrolaimus superbus TaxID=310955 RepID=A0A914YW32_9BILA
MLRDVRKFFAVALLPFLKFNFFTNEAGTEAAAATGMMMMAMSLPPPPEKFVADHPFLFFLADKNQNIHFTGVHAA